MNLLDILCHYLDLPNETEGHAYLLDLVRNAGMPRSLVKHIEGCRKTCKVSHQGTFQTKEGENDVNVWTLQSHYPEMVS